MKMNKTKYNHTNDLKLIYPNKIINILDNYKAHTEGYSYNKVMCL